MSRFSLSTTLGRLRLLSWIEGISFLILLGITMPLKYWAGMPEPNQIVGMAHGVLFVGYVLALLQATIQYRWGFFTLLKGFVASIVPFGTFWAERALFVERVGK